MQVEVSNIMTSAGTLVKRDEEREGFMAWIDPERGIMGGLGMSLRKGNGISQMAIIPAFITCILSEGHPHLTD